MEDDSPIRLKLSTFQYAANDPCEDTLVVQHDEAGLYVGIFDGHGGDPVSQRARREAHPLFKALLAENGGDVERALYDSYLELDARHVDAVKELMAKCDERTWKQLGSGSCAIVAHLNKGSNVLTVSNLGDSRCVLGTVRTDSGFLEAVEMSIDHSATTDKERLRIRQEHPNDPTCISERWDEYVEEYAWFVKNRARFTRSIGDSCMKDPEIADFYNRNIPRGPPKMLPLPTSRPYISTQAETKQRKITQGDQFLIMACDGLWDEVSSDQAVAIVEKILLEHEPSANIAEKLVQFALVKILRRLQVEEPELNLQDVEHLISIPPGGEGRRGLHDDITVSILIFEQGSLVEAPKRSKWGVVRKSIFGLKKNLSQNRLLKWYSAIDELLAAKGAEGSVEDGDAIPVQTADEYARESYVLSGSPTT